MATNLKQMIQKADAVVPRITPTQARAMLDQGNTLVVDVRESREIERTGVIAGAVHVSRGMLEFRADPESPSHDPVFAKEKTLILYCASGGRSALSGMVLKELGYKHVYNLGTFKSWADSGGETIMPCAPE